MAIPEHPSQDTYSRGFDVVRLVSSEFGLSPYNVRQQVSQAATMMEIDDQPYTGDRFFIPVDQAGGKWVTIMGPDIHWRMRFPSVPE